VESAPVDARPQVRGTESVLWALFAGTGVCWCCPTTGVRTRGRGALFIPASAVVLRLPTDVETISSGNPSRVGPHENPMKLDAELEIEVEEAE